MPTDEPAVRPEADDERNPMPIVAKKALKPRTKPAEVRRDDILRAATSLFIAGSVGATTIDEIAARAGVAKGTFYLYFSSKEDLVAALRERVIDGFCARVRAAVEASAPGDWTGRLQGWVRAGVDAYLEDYQMHDIVFHDYRPDQRRMKSDHPVLIDLSGLLAAGAKAGAWSVEHPHFTAIVVFQGLHGAVDAAIAEDMRDGAELAAKLSALFVKMLQPG